VNLPVSKRGGALAKEIVPGEGIPKNGGFIGVPLPNSHDIVLPC